ncbi:hypothetical protein FE257_009226 [Aspergillus nanangensis]|uniref:Alcohol acetyltransferase n=1 Tax=Aspergillus nanangensis TaxID=2582783 RepID=A0AAD4CKJ0_ASPNN|nr:hypothetical protein FE257_009226 [Aspergillus nanangensis]
MRHALGWYRALIVTGLYTIKKSAQLDTTSINSYIPALKKCIHTHPMLNTTIENEGSEAPAFTQPAKLDLRNHIQIIDPKSPSYASMGELEVLQRVTLETHDQLWVDIESIPQWKVVVLPLPDEVDSTEHRIYILYAYSHTHGDGKSGLAFHKSLLQGLQTRDDQYDQDPIYQCRRSPFPPPLEEVCELRISWSFLLSTLFGAHLPGFLCNWLDLQPSGCPSPRVYLGIPMRHNPDNFHTGCRILIVDKALLESVLATCREHHAKLTGLLNQLVVRALSKALPPESDEESFIGQIVVDLRSMIPAYSNDTMGNCVSAIHETSPRFRGDSGYDDMFWEAVRRTTSRLAGAAGTLDDQPVGLLKYLSNYRGWFSQKLGQNRDSSYEISNLGVFDPSLVNESDAALHAPRRDDGSWRIQRMVFSQPANVTASPLNFQAVTTVGGEMVVTLSWQVGVLGVADEDVLTADIMANIEESLRNIV